MDKGIVRLAPSILSADFAYLGKQVGEAEEAGARRSHRSHEPAASSNGQMITQEIQTGLFLISTFLDFDS